MRLGTTYQLVIHLGDKQADRNYQHRQHYRHHLIRSVKAGDNERNLYFLSQFEQNLLASVKRRQSEERNLKRKDGRTRESTNMNISYGKRGGKLQKTELMYYEGWEGGGRHHKDRGCWKWRLATSKENGYYERRAGRLWIMTSQKVSVKHITQKVIY